MKKTILTRVLLGLGLLALAAPTTLNAQPAPTSTTYYNGNYISANFSITAPAAIAGSKNYSIARVSAAAVSTNNWGRLADSTWINVPLIKAVSSNGAGGTDDSACNPILNGSGSYPTLLHKFAFIRRGNCEFGAKALAAQNAGALGVIIVNNIPGAPVAMGAGAVGTSVTIPVLMITDVDGAAIEAQMAAGQAVTLTLTGWISGFTHDIAILNSGVDNGHAYAIPQTQLDASNGNPKAYKLFTGAFIANFGTANEASVKLVNHVSFTPTGGAATPVYADSIAIGAFNTIDSVKVPVSANTYDLHPTGTGRYDATYTLSGTATDQSASNNSQVASTYVTDSIFCKGRFDFAKGHPVVVGGYGLSTATDYVFGPMYYLAKGGYAARKVQFSISENTQPNLSNLAPMNIYLWRWVDGRGGNPVDNTIQNSELILTGIASKTFTVNDSNRIDSVITLNWRNPTGAATNPVRLVDTSWYWIGLDAASGTFLGSDLSTNMYPRSYFQSKTVGMKDQMYAPMFRNNKANMDANPTGTPDRYPFTDNGSIDSVEFTEQGKTSFANVALHISKNVVPTAVPNGPDNFKNVSLYPNPAVSVLNVKMQLGQQAAHVWYTIADNIGRTITRVNHNNVLAEELSLSLNGLASGQYYLIINADEDVTMRPFTITAK